MCWYWKYLTDFFLILNFEISCVATVQIHRLHIGINTNSYFRGLFYHLYLPLVLHSQFWGRILKIDFKTNVGCGTEGIFLPHVPFHGLVIWNFKTFWLKILSTMLNLRLSKWYQRAMLDFSDSPNTTSDILYEKLWISWIYWIFHVLSEINNVWIYCC